MAGRSVSWNGLNENGDERLYLHRCRSCASVQAARETALIPSASTARTTDLGSTRSGALILRMRR